LRLLPGVDEQATALAAGAARTARRASPASRSSYPTASRWPPRWPVHRPSQARPVPLDSAALPATRPLAAVDRDSLSSRPWWCLL